MPEFRRPPTEKAWLPPKVFSGPNAVSVLDISLFNLSWPDIFFFFETGMCKLVPKCLYERSVTHSLLGFFYHVS